MLKSQIIEATSFIPNKRVDFTIPSSLCKGIKLVDIGVYGQQAYPADPVLGQLAIIKSIRLTEQGQVLSQYDRRFSNLMQYKSFQVNNTKQRCIKRKIDANNYGLVINNGGSDVTPAGNVGGQAIGAESVKIRPRICVDKKDLTRIALTQQDTKLAMLDLSDCLGFMNAQWDSANMDIMGYVPCHLFKNLKLSIEFNDVSSVAAGTNVAQPYLIMDILEDPVAEKAFMGKQAQWAEFELEEIYIDNAAQSTKFLNSFYGKTLGNMHVLASRAGVRLSPNLGGESLNLLVNQVPLFQQGGVDSLGKRAAFTQMVVEDLYVPLTSDRVLALVDTITASADDSNTSIFEGPANSSGVSSNYYSQACSYLAIPIQQKINSIQLKYTRTGADAGTYLLFWGEVLKVMTMDQQSGAPVVSYV